jgi:AraC-like DNA-binding protein
MRSAPADQVRGGAPAFDIACPPWPGRLHGVSMAGFRARSADLVEMSVVPYPAVTMFLDFGDGLLIDGASGQRQQGSVVAGLTPGAVFSGRGRDIDCLQIRLSPVVAYTALGSSAELSGTVATLTDVWGREAALLHDQLRAAASWSERFAIAAAALGRRCEAGRAADPEITYAWRRITASQGRVRVDRLAAETGWSRKHLWSRFRSQIGLTPKRAAQLVRFDHAAHRLAAGHSAARVAGDSGYADQSHLHRDVMAFAGLTPTAVAVAPWLAVDDFAWADPGYLSAA